MKYKLINNKTKEEHLCDKVTIDEFDYYVSDESILKNNIIECNGKIATVTNILNEDTFPFLDNNTGWRYSLSESKKVIATNNPNIDIPKVVDEVEILADHLYTNKFTSYKLRRQGFKTGYNKSQQTHPFSKEDMIEFAKWLSTLSFNVQHFNENGIKPFEELLQLWKEQQPKVIYYNE